MTIPVSNINYSVATGGSSTAPFITLLRTRPPTQNDTTYAVTQRWVNTSTGLEYILTGFNTPSGSLQANWLNITSGGSSNLNSLTGNIGGVVTPTASNINVVGDGTTIEATGNPGTSTITLSAIASSSFTWVNQTTGNFSAVAAHGYLVSTRPAIATLPVSPNFGDTIAFVTSGAANFLSIDGVIRIGSANSSTACRNTAIGDSIWLVYLGTYWYSIGAPQGVWNLT